VRVYVEDDVFGGGVHVVEIKRLLYFAYERRHRVLVDRRGEHCARWWAAQADRDEMDAYDAALAWSEETEVLSPSAHEVRVAARGASSALGPDAAREVLSRPFVVLVEDDRSDRAFLEAVARETHSQTLAEFVRKAWLDFRSRGGIERIPTIAEDVLRDTPGDVWRLFAVFDSDGDAPGQRSRDARNALARCEAMGIRAHVLQRRATENYLPRHALAQWVGATPQRSQSHQRRLETLWGPFFESLPARRHHFHMKGGMNKMTLGALYLPVPEDVKRVLNQGFGADLTEAFETSELRAADLREDGSWDELSGLIHELMRHVL
jgi:hypothetical protein